MASSNQPSSPLPAIERSDAYFRLRQQIEEFYYDEAELIDNRHFEAWLSLLHEDLRYFMPMRRNVKFGEHAEHENTRIDEGISWFNEDKWTLGKRVEQILTGIHYAEEPLSRTTHIVTNVQVQSASPSVEAAADIKTSCRFMVYLNRVDTETYTFVGKRYDRLVNEGQGWQVIHREIILDQNVLMAKNMTTFF